jgi:hypothetical protein
LDFAKVLAGIAPFLDAREGAVEIRVAAVPAGLNATAAAC